jgi:hypothetical protein
MSTILLSPCLVCFLYKMVFTLVKVHIVVLWLTTPCRWVKAFRGSIRPSSINIDVNAGSVRQLGTSGEAHYTSFSVAKWEFVASEFFFIPLPLIGNNLIPAIYTQLY